MSREIDEACARALGLTVTDRDVKIQDALADTYWTDRAIAYHGGGARIPDFSTDPAAARLLEDEIERRGLQDKYIGYLVAVSIGEDGYPIDVNTQCWMVLRATPEQRARAFLEAIS